MKLIYHPPNQTTPGVSPFDAAIMRMVADKHVRIACPYLGVEYLNRVIAKAKSWQLLTDVTAWLQSHGPTARPGIVEFILKHSDLIHHCPNLHAKVVIAESTALIGSANLTATGITERTEMAVLTDEPDQLEELRMWYEELWACTGQVDPAELQVASQQLPHTPSTPISRISSPFPGVHSRLVVDTPAVVPHTTASPPTTAVPASAPVAEVRTTTGLYLQPAIMDLLLRQTALVRQLAQPLLNALDAHADRVYSTAKQGGDIRHSYANQLMSEILFSKSGLTLVLTVPEGSINDSDFIWNTATSQSRMDRGRVKLRAGIPVPAKIFGWIEQAARYSRR